MKILLAGTYPDGTADKFRAMLPGHEIAAAETQEQYDAVEDCEIIVVRVLKTPEKTLRQRWHGFLTHAEPFPHETVPPDIPQRSRRLTGLSCCGLALSSSDRKG